MLNYITGKRTFRYLLIEPFSQIKLGVYVIAITLIFLGLLSAFFVNSFNEQYQHVMEIFRVVDPKFQWQLVTNDIFYTNVVRFGALTVVFILSLFLVIFRVTHKYYGPLVAIERFVEAITDGDYDQRVVIRKGDELQVVVEKLNKMAQSLEERHSDASVPSSGAS